MNDTQLYEQILGLAYPWSVESVDLDLLEEKVAVNVNFDSSYGFCCPECSKESPRYDSVSRTWRHLDTCQYVTTIKADIPRVKCAQHGVRQVKVPWSESGSRYTLLFESLVIRWLKETNISGVSRLMRLDWDAVHGIQRRAVERGLSRRKKQAPVNITIDETSKKKGQDYLTIVSEGATVLYVAENRKKSSIDCFWETLSAEALNGIESVSVDLWKPYRRSVLDNVPNAEEKLCLDRYHVAGYFGKALNDVRKKEHKNLLAEGDETLKGMKYDFLRTSSKIDNRARKGFLEIAQSSLKTSRAWAIKETAHLIWEYVYIGAAKKAWERLIGWMKRSRIEPMKKLSYSIEKHLWMILNAIRLKVSSGCAEGNNSRIQRIKKMACGFRNTENFKYAIYFHLGNLDMMPKFIPT